MHTMGSKPITKKNKVLAFKIKIVVSTISSVDFGPLTSCKFWVFLPKIVPKERIL